MKFLPIRRLIPVAGLLVVLTVSACAQQTGESRAAQPAATEAAKDLSGLHKAYFASGCFWCVEAVFESVRGVEEAISGYAGGSERNPSYEQVGAGRTSHAEAVEVYYDSTVIDFPTLVKVYYGSHDATSVNRQGPDRGPQYRSIAFYQNAAEKAIIEGYIESLYQAGEYERGAIATEIEELERFWPAEDYHQNYERLHPDNPYVRSVSVPRLKRFQAKYPELLKETH